MKPTPFGAFQRFQDSLGKSVADLSDESYDLESLLCLRGDELYAAEELLIDMVKKGPDTRAMDALAVVKCKRAADAIRAHVKSTSSDIYVPAYRALVTITGEETLPGVLVDMLKHGGATGREWAAQELGRCDTQDIRQALLDALDDKNRRLREAAASSLLMHHGFDAEEGMIPMYLSALLLEIESPLPVIAKKGIKELHRVLDALEAGKEKASIFPRDVPGRPSDAFTRFQTSYAASPRVAGSHTQSYDVDALGKLSGAERAWAEALVLKAITDGDPRAPAAIVEIGIPEALAILEEAIHGANAKLAAAIKNALEKLHDVGS